MSIYRRPTHIFPGCVLDLDGTVYLGDTLLPGAERTIESLRAAGKPSPITARAILARLQLPASACLIAGDRLEADVRMGQEAGMATAVVLTGVTTPKDLVASEIQPDYVLRSLDELLPP